MDQIRCCPRPAAARKRRPSALSRQLDDEWSLLRHRRAALDQARRWQVTDQPFDDLDELLVLAGHRVAPTRAADAVLGALVEIGRDDELATRVVLQRILPGLLAIVRKWRRIDTIDGSFEELLGAAWLVIHAYRPSERPMRVAANLVRDAAYRAFIAPGRRLSATEISIDPRTLDETPAVIVLSSCEELANLLAEARADGLDPADLDFVRALLDAGSPTALAKEQKVTTRTIRNHRIETVANLRAVAMVA